MGRRMTTSVPRAISFVDGFNLYHSIECAQRAAPHVAHKPSLQQADSVQLAVQFQITDFQFSIFNLRRRPATPR